MKQQGERRGSKDKQRGESKESYRQYGENDSQRGGKGRPKDGKRMNRRRDNGESGSARGGRRDHREHDSRDGQRDYREHDTRGGRRDHREHDSHDGRRDHREHDSRGGRRDHREHDSRDGRRDHRKHDSRGGRRDGGFQERRTKEYKVSPARRVAFQALRSLFEEEAFLQPVLSLLAAEANLNAVDRRLAWELVLGVSRQWGTLVAHLNEQLSQGIDSIPADVLRALALGAYQLIHLDRIPAYAAVNESVTLAKECDPKFTGVVNKVLKLLMENGLSELKHLKGHAKLAAELSHPEWWVKSQVKHKGLEATKRIALSNNRHAPLSIRFKPKANAQEIKSRLEEEGAILTDLKWAQDGYTLKVDRPFSLRSHKESLWYVQDEASQLVSLLLAPKIGDVVWDVCAAPGGKSLTLLHMMGENGVLLSTDLHERKTRDLAGRLSPYANVTVCQHDASFGAPKGQIQTFDKILLDAPCSALGVIRRHPEIRWRRTFRDVKRAAKKQRNLLEAVALHLKVGGILVYSVCTDTQEETTEVISDFLQAFPDFSLCAPPTDSVWDELYQDALSLNPADHNTDGFYAVRLTRTR